MSRATHQEPIRRSTILPVFSQSLAEVYFRPHADFASLQVFTCDRLSCVLTKEACAANYTRTNAPISCKGCPIGVAHAEGQRYRHEPGIHTASELAMGLSCVRCERNEHTATRFTARFRLVRNHTLCISCVNREYECVKGKNSKGATPVRWAHLKQATVTIQDAAGDWKTLDIGLRADYLECTRYVERLHPGATLIKTAIGGEIISQFSLWTPLPFSPWEPSMVRDERPSKPRRTYTRRSTPRTSRKTSTVAPPVDWDDWDTPLYANPASDDHSDADGNGLAHRNGWLPPMSEEDDAAYRAAFEEPALDPESIAAFWDGMNADGLPDFIEWLCEDWTTLDIKPVAPTADIPASVAPAIESEPLVDDSENPDQESEWAGCYVVRDGVTTYATDYAREHGISDEAAAIEIGLCDPEYADEPEAAAAPEPQPAPEPVKAEPALIPKKLTGKQLRKLEKARRRAERQAAAPAPAPEKPTIGKSPRAIAVTARALIQVAFELNGIH